MGESQGLQHRLIPVLKQEHNRGAVFQLSCPLVHSGKAFLVNPSAVFHLSYPRVRPEIFFKLTLVIVPAVLPTLAS
jgi:hypothetical protein